MTNQILAISKNYFLDGNSLYDKRKPRINLKPITSEIKIKIYEDRVKGWFIDIATGLKNDNEAGFIILSIATAYVEGNQQFREGKLSKNKSRKFFVNGMKRIFHEESVPELILNDYYAQIRCGLFHDGMTGRNVVISSNFSEPLRHIGGQIIINPHKFLDKIEEDLSGYIRDLKTNQILRDNFVTRFDAEHGNKI